MTERKFPVQTFAAEEHSVLLPRGLAQKKI